MKLLIFSIILIVVTSVGQMPAQSVVAGTEQIPALWGTMRCYVPTISDLTKSSDLTSEVKVGIRINKEGKVKDAAFMEGNLSLKRASLQAARQWQFVPVIKNEKAADTTGQIIFRFGTGDSVQADYLLSLQQVNDTDPIPPATLPASDAEREWWERVRTAGREFSIIRKAFSLEYRNKKVDGRTDQEVEKIRSQVFSKYQSAFQHAEAKLRALYEEQKLKSFKAPIQNSFPVPLLFVGAFYTESARQNKIEGSVFLSVLVSETGEVKVVRIVNGLPEGLNQQAVTAAERCRFFPPTKDGAFFLREIEVEYSFGFSSFKIL